MARGPAIETWRGAAEFLLALPDDVRRRLEEDYPPVDLDEWVRERRKPDRPGGQVAWRMIVSELAETTGIHVSYEALRTQFGDPSRT